MWQETITVPPPYDFDQALARLSIDPLNQLDRVRKKIKIPVYKVKEVATVTAVGTNENPVFIIEGKGDQTLMVSEVTRILRWDVSLTDIQQHFLATNLRDLFIAHEGTPFVCDFSLYSCLMRSIIHQQLNLKFAHTLTERFVDQYGEKVDGVAFYSEPEIIAGLPYEALRELQFSQRKAEYVIDTSKLIAAGELQLDELQDMTDEAIMAKLTNIRGIGPWTVQILLMFGLGRPNFLPKADIGIQNAIKKLFQLETKPTAAEIDKLSIGWSPYQSYASLYLWRSIET